MAEVQIRGERAYITEPTWVYRGLAAGFDLALAWVALCLVIVGAGILPLPDAQTAGLYALILVGSQAVRRLLGLATPGERVWDIVAVRKQFPKIELNQAYPLKSSRLSAGTFATALMIMAACWASYKTLAVHPLGIKAQSLEWEAFMPEQATGGDQFSVVPFYYSLGAWPSVFQGKPVFFNFPYEKGPPTRFAGQIQARWSMPDIRLTFEGPKTPLGADQKALRREEVKTCLVSFWSSALNVLGCLGTREAVLSRHLQALKSAHYEKLSLDWIHVGNKSLALDDQLQGFYLSAAGPTRGQDRFVMITPRGTEQAFILDYPISSEGRHARQTFQQAIQSLRVSDELEPGRAWVDQAIARIHLGELTHADDQQLPARLAEVQAMLIARISVDPKLYDTYFHLGGTSLLLAQYAAKARARARASGGGADAATAADVAGEYLLLARALIESASKYALDIAPGDPRTAQLHEMLLAAQKL